LTKGHRADATCGLAKCHPSASAARVFAQLDDTNVFTALMLNRREPKWTTHFDRHCCGESVIRTILRKSVASKTELCSFG